jgi:hypothetical protein
MLEDKEAGTKKWYVVDLHIIPINIEVEAIDPEAAAREALDMCLRNEVDVDYNPSHTCHHIEIHEGDGDGDYLSDDLLASFEVANDGTLLKQASCGGDFFKGERTS